MAKITVSTTPHRGVGKDGSSGDSLLDEYMQGQHIKTIMRKYIVSDETIKEVFLEGMPIETKISKYAPIKSVSLVQVEFSQFFKVETSDGSLITSDQFENIIRRYMKLHYGKEDFELVYMYEMELLSIMPKDLEDEESRLKIFSDYINSNRKIIERDLTIEDNAIKKSDFYRKASLGFIPLWCEQNENDYFQREKARYIKSIKNRYEAINKDFRDKNVRFLTFKSDIKDFSKYRIFSMLRSKESNTHVRWVHISVQILDMLGIKSLHEDIKNVILSGNDM